MSSDVKRRFFIALVPPQAIQDYANEVKQYFADRYDSRAAQKSPPHITLQPPFEWPFDQLSQLKQRLAEFAAIRPLISITLEGFAAFPPRVIFINVHRSADLLNLQAELAEFIEKELNIVDERSSGRAFKPHMTVAFRDLTKQNFQLAWPEFQERSVRFDWLATHLTLLIHDGRQWVIHQNFPFQSEA